MNKILLTFILGIFLLSFTSALVPTSNFDENVGDYGKYEINDWMGLGNTIEEATLIENTFECGQYCSATKNIILYEESTLVNGVRFYRIMDDGSQELSQIRDYKLEYYTGSIPYEVNDYEYQCGEQYKENNGSIMQNCENVLIGIHTEYTSEWQQFSEGQVFPAGSYQVRLSGEKRPDWAYDWQIKLQNSWTTAWSVWGAYGSGNSYVNLSSPSNGATVYTNVVTTNATAQVIGGAFLVNATLYDNSTGSWGARNSTNFSLTENITADSGWDTSSSQTAKSGFNITIKNSFNLTKVFKPSSSGATRAYVYYSNNNSQIANATFSGDVAVFNLRLGAGQQYSIVADNNGAAYNWPAKNYAGGYPIVKTNFNFTVPNFGLNSYSTSYIVGLLGIEESAVNTTGTASFNNNYSAGQCYLWNFRFFDTDGASNFAYNTPSNRTFCVDSVAPTITLNYPTSLITYGGINATLQLNITVNDTNLDQVLYDYNGTNVTLTGAISGVYNISNITLSTKKNVTIYANDTAGNMNATTFSWDYKVFENSQTYNNATTEGALENFSANFTVNGVELTSVVFYYNNTYTDSPSITSSGNSRILTVTNFEIPNYAVATNVSLFWFVTLNDSSTFNTSTRVQLVRPVNLDNCSTYTYPLFNLSLVDERAKTALNGTIEVLYQILNVPNYNVVQNLTGKFTNINKTRVCSENNLSGQNLAYSAQIKYYADSYASELYNIQRGSIATASNITLFDLNSSQSTEFLIKYQDNDLIKVPDAVIQLMRKYIPQDTYEVVEAPLTSAEGTAVVHVDLDSNIYKIIVVKNGEILDIFDNIVFNCESELSGQCTQNLYGSIDPQNEVPISTLNDFIYTITPEGNNTIDITFSVPSGQPATINIELVQKDIFGNTTACNTTIVSSGGSIECVYNETITESYLDLIITKDGLPQAIKSYLVEENRADLFSNNNFFIVFMFLLSIVGMAFSSPEWIIINSVVVLFIAGALFLLNGMSFVIGLGGLMWLLIGAAILISKISKQEDR